MSTLSKHWRIGLVLVAGMLTVALETGCYPDPSQREVALRATVETLRDELAQLRTSTPAPTQVPATAVPTFSAQAGATSTGSDFKEWWVANHRATTIWSSSSGGKALGLVPQWCYFLVLEPQVQKMLHLFLPGGQRASYVGDGWVEAVDLGPVGVPPAGVIDTSTLPKKQAPQALERGSSSVSASRSTSGLSAESKLLDWREVNARAETDTLELRAYSILLGHDSYGGPYGSSINVTRGTKIILVDLSLYNTFRPGASAIEVHVDFFVVGDSEGNEYRGLPVPITNALPDRFFLSAGQGYRGIVAFIVPQPLKSGRLYFTNFLGPNSPPERLTVYLRDIP